MGFFDALLGRTKPVAANLDALFGLPGARITLEATEGLRPTGQAGVCFKATAGQAFASTETELTALLNLSDPNDPSSTQAKVNDAPDEYGYSWIELASNDFDGLVTRVHVVNSTLHEHDYDAQLLCSVFGFGVPAGDSVAAASVYLVYLYNRGTFYPFVPTGVEKRDNEAELRLKNELGQDLAIETDLDRWFPIWKLPVH